MGSEVGMNKSQLVEDLMSFRPDLKRSFLEGFGTDTLNNMLTIERSRVADEVAEMAIESFA
ncbi:MAG: hypothetical protein DUD32_09980 [Lactobacillus sp.]|nr:MAG: hypothetical protein DUD32_09980 [Lactobacillus sp.]